MVAPAGGLLAAGLWRKNEDASRGLSRCLGLLNVGLLASWESMNGSSPQVRNASEENIDTGFVRRSVCAHFGRSGPAAPFLQSSRSWMQRPMTGMSGEQTC